MDGVKLHGFWESPFSSRVIWALKLKGIPFDYIEEDLPNKSALLLQYNPVHKKIPVLVHGSRPVCESMVIVEYLEETWPQYQLLPIDPHERAVVRFWVKFIEEKSPNIWIVYRSVGEEQEKAVRDSVEMLSILEQHGPNRGKKFFGGDGINIVDIAFGGVALWVGAIEEESGRKLFDAGKFPRLNAWKANFESSPMIAENLPDQEKLREHLARLREKRLSSSTCE